MVPNAAASARGTTSAVAQRKSISKTKNAGEFVVPMEAQRDEQHERVKFIDNETGQPVMTLYRTTEEAQPISDLWSDLLRERQDLRSHVTPDILGSFLTPEELNAIDLKNNHHSVG